MRAAALWAHREIRRDIGSLLIVALLVAVAGGAVIAGVAGARRAGASVDRFMSSSSAVRIYTQGGPIDVALRSELESDARVTAVLDYGVVIAGPAVAPVLGGVTIVVPAEFWGELVRPRLLEGRPPVGPNEIVVSERTTELGLSVGDTVAMEAMAGEHLEACFVEGVCHARDAGTALVTGVVRLAEDLTPAVTGGAVFIAPGEFADALGGDDMVVGYITDVFGAPGVDPQSIVSDYSTGVDRGTVKATINDVAGAQRAAGLQHDGLLIASAIVAAAGVLIAGQAFGRFLARRSVDAERLAMLGMTSGDRTGAGWFPGLAGSTIGALGTIPVAVVLSPLFPQGIARRADPDVGFHADWPVIGAGVALTGLVGSGVAYGAALLWSRTSMRTGSTTAVSLAGRVTQRFRLGPSASLGTRFALDPGRGSQRVPVGTALATSAVAVALLVGALVMAASLDGLLTSGGRYGAAWDLQVSAGERTLEVGERIATDERADGVTLAMSSELGVAAAGARPVQRFTVGTSSIKGSVEPALLDGRELVGPNEALLGSDTFDALGVSLGDTIDVSGPLGNRSMVVVGRVMVPVLGADSPDTGLVVPLQTMLDLGGLETVSDIDVQAALFVSVADGVDAAALGRDIVGFGAVLDGPFRPSSVSVLDEVRTIPIFVAAFVALLGSLAMLHALVVSARLRRIELATFRALGALPRDARNAMRWQGSFTAGIAVVIGLPLGLVAGQWLWRSIAERNNVVAVVDTPWPVLAVFAGAVMGASLVLAAWPAWTAGRRRPAHDLRAE